MDGQRLAHSRAMKQAEALRGEILICSRIERVFVLILPIWNKAVLLVSGINEENAELPKVGSSLS
jgi:hypothetical protein